MAEEFQHEYHPTIQETHPTDFEITADGATLVLEDIPWDSRYSSLTEGFRSSVGLMILFAVDDRQSFEDVQRIHDCWLSYNRNDGPKTILLVANKCDVSKTDAAVQLAEGVALSQRLECEFWPISTKHRKDVVEVFQRFLDLLRRDHHYAQQDN